MYNVGMLNKIKNSKVIILTTIVVIVLVVVIGVFFLYKYDKNQNSITSSSLGKIKQTINSESGGSSTANSIQGGVKDNGGQSTSTTIPSSEWTASSNGDITLQQPIANSTLASGDKISGIANVNNVQFILSDSTVGLIDQGNLNVVNGSFSGSLQFTPHAKVGTLEIYYPNPSNGAEEDIINVNVNYDY
jgi:type II secretory pathway pseudopilin PulG